MTESTVRRLVKSFKEAQSENPNTDLEVVSERKQDFLRHKAQNWYPQEIVQQMEARKWSQEIKIDVRFSAVKPLHIKWIV